ncbi:DUF1501 domain-containing protein [Paludisphaera borealis]|uniref:DUF1501 domain-containing protein n=1 Tax=Paludisphaera borealis TaxID=1387353 RepID=A0A1U7CJ10_9BACT|nr:DUF1501 domain-containing protein [Paludisphaera borealis]APW58924.1 hypothetical protein BSF38_00336 [Paludisphaera borealis]
MSDHDVISGESGPPAHRVLPLSRRDWLIRAGAGFGALPLFELLSRDSQAGEILARPVGGAGASDPSWRRPATAKSVIFLFMEGGPSQIDLFDPKPLLNKLAGQRMPAAFKPVITPMGEFYSPILPSRRKWKQYGESGAWVSDWLPHITECVDDLAIIRSCWSNGLNHVGGVTQMNTGSTLSGRPSLGSWASYGLGTENQNLPAFVVIQDNARSTVAGGPRNWGAGFMPAVYQGTRIGGGAEPIPNLLPPATIAADRQQAKLTLLDRLNRRHLETRFDQTELDARIQSFELAFRMQAEAPAAVDLDDESAETRTLYGLDDPATENNGRNCLLARRLVERGVRFVQLYCGAGSRWDSHQDIEKNHGAICRSTDKPVAGLIKDLKRRGLLDDTLVVWGGEFGRTPMSEKGDGRDHNPYGFTMWMAGGGIKPGVTVGATDDAGLHAIEDRLHVHDLHATILHCLGADHSKLIYRHQGRPERPTVNEGRVCRKLLA